MHGIGPNPKELFLSFLRLGMTAFGGPAMVAYIGEMSVKRKKWLDQEAFKNGVALCQTIPGATAIQTAAYVGLQAGGIVGALSSYIGFALPAFTLMIVFSSLYAASRDLPWVVSLFAGLQVIVIALVANAAYTFGKTSLKGFMETFLAAAAAFSFFIGVSPFYVILGTALVGALSFKIKVPPEAGSAQKADRKPFVQAAILVVSVLGGLLALYLFSPKLLELALLMLKVDLFAFGGGFASVPLMLHEVVDVQGWLDSKVFMDGIALGQVTPGPIVITATFVGYLTQGLVGGLVATVAIFTPSFVVLVATAPFFDRLRRSRLFSQAVKGILCSFVGLLLFVTIKFALAVPWDPVRILLGVASLIAVLKKIDILYIVPIGAAISLVLLR
jgi:chromate transporter